MRSWSHCPATALDALVLAVLTIAMCAAPLAGLYLHQITFTGRTYVAEPSEISSR